MAKKKQQKKDATASSFVEAVGFKNIFENERLNFFIGLLLFILAVYLTLAFISYFTTGTADQSMIEAPRDGEFLNQHREFSNSCGSVGAYAAWFFIKRCFGLAAFMIPAFLLLTGIHMMRAYRVNLLKWFMSMMVIMIWASITLAKFLSPFFIDACFNPGGDHGLFVCQYIENLIGMPGLTAVLGLTAVAFLTYISAETILIIRKVLNPTKFIDKVKFKITNNDPTEQVDSYETQMGISDEPTVFDDPDIQQVIFDNEGGAKVIDKGYKTDETAQSAASGLSGTPGNQASPADLSMQIEVAKGDETADATAISPAIDDLKPYDPKRDLENYHYPDLDLLKKYDNDGKPYINMAEQNANKNRIVEVLRTFGVEISSIKATVGPTITLYEITLAPGVRISKIRSLEDDIALSLAALGIRIIAPIPGKGTVGIEVPNAKQSIVSMESILNSKKFQETTM